MVENCRICTKRKQQRPQPLIPTPFPEHPWQKVATDLFELETADYLLVVDYFSRYVETTQTRKTKKSAEIMKALKDNFARHGIPEELRSDNGPQYSSAEFTHFAREW